MASRGQTITITYTAWDTSANVGKTGDVANHTLRWVKDGVSAAPTNASTEVDATNAPGQYNLVLTAAECTADFGVLAGKSSTASVVIIPTRVSFELLPTALVSSRVDANATVVGDKTGYSIGAGGIPVGAFAASALDASALASDAANEIRDAIKALVIEAQGSYTLQQALSIIFSVLAGVTSTSGATVSTPNGSATRVVATIDGSNNRTAMALTPSA